MTVSYLHGSFRDLASAAGALVKKAREVTVVFMDEPGEHQMLLHRINDKELDLEIVLYEDWQRWKMRDRSHFQRRTVSVRSQIPAGPSGMIAPTR
jgi:hypothetical protein